MDKSRNLKNTLEQYKLIIFDLDGTLVDLGVDWKSLKQEIAMVYKKEKGIEIQDRHLSNMLKKIKEDCSDQCYQSAMQIIEKYELEEENYHLNTELISIANSLEGKYIVIYSMNTRKCVMNFIDRYLSFRPDAIVAKEDMIEKKPTNKDIIAIIKQFQVKKNETILVGNSLADKLSADQSEIDSILISL